MSEAEGEIAASGVEASEGVWLEGSAEELAGGVDGLVVGPLAPATTIFNLTKMFFFFFSIKNLIVRSILKQFGLLTLTLASGWSLDFTGSRKRQSKGLVYGDTQWGAATIEQWAKALWWWLDNIRKLWAAWRWWVWWVSCDIVEAWCQACECSGTAWLSHGSTQKHGPKDEG